MSTFQPIPNYESLYKINRQGDVIGFKDRPRKSYPGRAGYPQILLSKDGKKTCFLVHRLVAATFIRPMEPGEVVNHLNGVITDNRVENLEITTPSGNMLHAYRVLGMTLQRGAARPWTKLTEKNVLEIRRLAAEKQLSQNEIAARFSINPGHVSAIVHRKKWDYLVG